MRHCTYTHHAAREKRGGTWGENWGKAMRNSLTAIQIKKAPPGKLGDGGGLYLIKTDTTGSWIYRYSHLGRRREMGLGSWPTLSLADARAARDRWERLLAQGTDPISAREAEREEQKRALDRADPTLAEGVDIVFAARRATLRGGGDRGRWRSPLDIHVLPKLGKRRVSTLHQSDIADTLRPIWHKMHPTAEKAWQRTRIVLSELKLMGYPADPFIADAASRILGDVIHQVRPTPSTPWQDMPELFAKLGDSPVDLALKFLMLTVVRAEAGRAARLSEIEGNVWTVPADRIKGREGKVRDFRVPLSTAAQAVVAQAARFGDDMLFKSHTGRPVTHEGLEKRLTALNEAGRPHGFRTSFRTWVQDTDACGWDVSEVCLGHTIGGKTERSYARSDLLDRRRLALEAWAAHLTGAKAGNVVHFHTA